MAAIDFLLNWNPTSERMHQVVLAGLFRHTALLELLGIPGAPTSLDVETQYRLYDFTVGLGPGCNAHVELKVDAALDEDQVKRQMAALRVGDILLYVLLGVARFRRKPAAFDWIRKKLERPPAADQIRIVDLPKMRNALAALADHIQDNDQRDLAVAYSSLLRRIASYTSGFCDKPLGEWSFYDWHGFFGEVMERLDLGDSGACHVPTPAGGFVACYWDFLGLPLAEDGEAYLQLEQNRLCFKVGTEKGDRALVRDRFSEIVLAEARKVGFPLKRPDRFGRGKTMTVAVLDGDYRSAGTQGRLDWEYIESTIRTARQVLDAAVRQCPGPPI
jgi:hypothetical protein